jgi:hypothetical protein
MPTQSARFGR